MRCLPDCLVRRANRRILNSALAVLAVLAFSLAPAARAQTFTLLHEFTNGLDGGYPMAGLTPDVAGNFYGTTEGGGSHGYGTVFKLSRRNGAWVLTSLYSFPGYLGGAYPFGGVTIGPDGALYGTASVDGHCDECGVAFRLTPPAVPCGSLTCPWVVSIIHMFMHDGVDGFGPGGDLIFDHAGNIYGTTPAGGSSGGGVVYELTPRDGTWTETILYNFGSSPGDGAQPFSGVVMDSTGNLYGTTEYGGSADYGVVFELTPSGSGWTETVLRSFTDVSPDGALPYAGVTLDGAGSFYGTTQEGGTAQCFAGTGQLGCGTVFHGSETIYSFMEPGLTAPGGPKSPVTLDAQGNIYGTSYADGANLYGNVFMLTAGQFVYTSLYDFTGGNDGRHPVGKVVRDSSGNLYGVASGDGYVLPGSVWEVTP